MFALLFFHSKTRQSLEIISTIRLCEIIFAIYIVKIHLSTDALAKNIKIVLKFDKSKDEIFFLVVFEQNHQNILFKLDFYFKQIFNGL